MEKCSADNRTEENMKKGKLIAGLIFLLVAIILAVGLVGVIQKLLLSGAMLMNDLGSMTIEEAATDETTAEPTPFLTEDDFNDPDPIVTMEPEELFSIPVEETIEELAQENEGK